MSQNAYEGGHPGFIDRLKTVGEQDMWFFDAMLEVPKVNPIIVLVSAVINLLFPGVGVMICAMAAQGQE